MIKQETFMYNGRQLVKTYSNAGKYIIQDGTGDKYAEAVDPADMHRTYTESDEDIEYEMVTEAEIVSALEEIL